MDDYDRPDILNALLYLDLAVQSSLGIAAIEAAFRPQLSKDSVVEMPRRQLGIRQIERPVSTVVQFIRQFANQRGFPAAAVAGKDGKPAPLRRIGKTSQYFFLLRCGKETIYRKVSCKGCGSKSIIIFKHGRYPP